MTLAFDYLLFLVVFLSLTVTAWLFERRMRRLRLMEEALKGSHELETALDERLRRMDDYRHDLAELLQGLDPELLRQVGDLDE